MKNLLIGVGVIAALLFAAATALTKPRPYTVFGVAQEVVHMSGSGFNLRVEGRVFGVSAGHICTTPDVRVEGRDLKVISVDSYYDICIFEANPDANPYTSAIPKAAASLTVHSANTERPANSIITGILLAPDAAVPSYTAKSPDICILSGGTLTVNGCKELVPAMLAIGQQIIGGDSGSPALTGQQVVGVVVGITLPRFIHLANIKRAEALIKAIK